MRQILTQFSFALAIVFCLTPFASPATALGAGIILALTVGNPYRRQGHRFAKSMLQICVVMLGFGMNLPVVLRAGTSGAALAAITISGTLLAGWWLGKIMSIRPLTVVLISAGTAICGGSAIAAVGSALDAEEGDMTVAMGTIFLLNAAALYLFPLVGHALGLSQHQFGLWAGVGIHDVSSVVGAAGRYGSESLQTATAVKLSRALWIVPLTLGMSFAMRGRQRIAVTNATFGFDVHQQTKRKVQIPWFIGLFLLASIIRSVVPAVASIAPSLTRLATIGLTLTLFLIGAGLTRQTLRAVGWKALGLGVMLWVLVGVGSLLLIRVR